MKDSVAIVGSDLDLIDDIQKSGLDLVGYFSLSEKKAGIPFLGSHHAIGNTSSEIRLILAVDDAKLRSAIFASHASRIKGYISTDAKISRNAHIDSTAVVYPMVFVSRNCEIGKGVKLSVGAQVHHESSIGNFSVVAPRALILGRVSIGERNFIGANATIGPGLSLASDVTIGMGANVLRNLEEGVRAWGNPARVVISEETK